MLYDDYIYLHKNAELGFKEFNTAKYLFAQLSKLKANIKAYNTGICAFFDFKKSETIAFRAEEDALPLKEQNQLSYCSIKNMHACGHDGHMAILLSLGRIIDALKDYKYNVLLVFQPSEESIGGANFLIPFLKNYKYKAFIGLHVFPKLKKGAVYSGLKPIFGSSVEINIKVKGQSSHVFAYNSKNDALKKAIAYIRKTEKNARKRGLFFHVGVLKSGVKRNICPSQAIIKASLRGKDNYAITNYIKELDTIKTKDIFVSHSKIIPCVENTFKEKAILFDKLKINLLKDTLFLADDFAFYDSSFQTLFFLLGTESKYFLHSEHFILEKKDLENGLEFYIKLLDYFAKN